MNVISRNDVLRGCRLAVALLASTSAVIPGSPLFAAEEAEPWPAMLREQMARVVTVGFKLNQVALESCPRKSASIGIALDYIGAYAEKDRAAVSKLLGMGDMPQLAAVVKGGPADQAGVHAGDQLIAINGEPVSKIIEASVNDDLLADELEQRLAQLPVDATIRLTLRREGINLGVEVKPVSACSVRYVIKTDGGITAFSDADNVAISSKLIAFTANDDELALVAGHELGHIANRDETAKTIAERRQMEDRADITGLHFSTCAGFNPEKGLQFWLRRDREDLLRWFRDPTHRSRSARVQLMRNEIPNIRCPVRP